MVRKAKLCVEAFSDKFKLDQNMILGRERVLHNRVYLEIVIPMVMIWSFWGSNFYVGINRELKKNLFNNHLPRRSVIVWKHSQVA